MTSRVKLYPTPLVPMPILLPRKSWKSRIPVSARATTVNASGYSAITIRSFGSGPTAADGAVQPATALAMMAALRDSDRPSDMNLLLPTGERPSCLKLILDLRAITLELAVYPHVSLVVPNAASVIRRNERVARRLNLGSGYFDWLLGQLAGAHTNYATTLRIDHRRLLQHCRGPKAVRRQGGGGGDKRTSLTHDAKSVGRCCALDVEGLAVLHSVATQ